MEISIEKPHRTKAQKTAPPPQAKDHTSGDANPIPIDNTPKWNGTKPQGGDGLNKSSATNSPDMGPQSFLSNMDPNPLPTGRYYETEEEPEEIVKPYCNDIVPFSIQNLPEELKARLTPIDMLPTYYWAYSEQFVPKEHVFNELRVRPLTVFDLERIYEARQTKSRKLILNVVASAIDRPLHLLTFGDFWYIMFWLKLNSYTKSPMQIIWRCPACEAKYRAANSIPAETVLNFDSSTDLAFFNLERLMRSSHKIIDMPKPPKIPNGLDIPRMQHFLAFNDYLDKNEGEKIKIGTAALYVKGDAKYTKAHPDSFQGKLDTLRLHPDSMEIYYNAQTLAVLLHHGVEEAARVRCQKEGCGVWYTVPMETDLLSFFPKL